jgi:hypothetical protein
MINYIKNWWKDYNKLETRIRLREILEDGVVVYATYICEYRVRFHSKEWRSITPFFSSLPSKASNEQEAKEMMDKFIKKRSTVHKTRDTIIKYP